MPKTKDTATQPVSCANCGASAEIMTPSDDDLAAGVVWLCESCGESNKIGADK